MSVWTTDKDRKAHHTVLWFPVWAISWVWTFHMGVFSPLPPPNMTFKHPEVIKHRVTVLTSLWGYESHELRANCCRSLFLLQWTLCWFTSHTKSSRQRQDSTLHAPCQAMQPLLLEGLLLSLTSAAKRKARRPSLVQNKSGGNLIVSKEAGRQESSPHDHFFDFFFKQNCPLGSHISQSTTASNTTTCFVEPLLSKHFPFPACHEASPAPTQGLCFRHALKMSPTLSLPVLHYSGWVPEPTERRYQRREGRSPHIQAHPDMRDVKSNILSQVCGGNPKPLWLY